MDIVDPQGRDPDGGLGFLAAGYLTAPALAERLAQARELTSAPIGVNVFVPGGPAEPGVAEAYAAALAGDARGAPLARFLDRYGPGRPISLARRCRPAP